MAYNDGDFSFITEDNLRLRNKIAKELVKYDLVRIINIDRIEFWRYFNKDENDFITYNIDNKFIRYNILNYEQANKYKLISHYKADSH